MIRNYVSDHLLLTQVTLHLHGGVSGELCPIIVLPAQPSSVWTLGLDTGCGLDIPNIDQIRDE